jgi:hypothetical protein
LILWDDLPPFKPEPGKVLRMNFLYADSDNRGSNAPYRMGIVPQVHGGHDPFLFKNFILMPPETGALERF